MGGREGGREEGYTEKVGGRGRGIQRRWEGGREEGGRYTEKVGGRGRGILRRWEVGGGVYREGGR